MKLLQTILFLLTLSTSFAETPCTKCDLEKVKSVQSNIKNLTYDIIFDFACSVDSTCKNNVEFSAASNGTLFSILEHSAGLYFVVLASGKTDYQTLLKYVESPIHDLIDLQLIYDNIKKTKAPKKYKFDYSEKIKIAATKLNKKIIE